jgi:hypothetical protein
VLYLRKAGANDGEAAKDCDALTRALCPRPGSEPIRVGSKGQHHPRPRDWRRQSCSMAAPTATKVSSTASSMTRSRWRRSEMDSSRLVRLRPHRRRRCRPMGEPRQCSDSRSTAFDRAKGSFNRSHMALNGSQRSRPIPVVCAFLPQLIHTREWRAAQEGNNPFLITLVPKATVTERSHVAPPNGR